MTSTRKTQVSKIMRRLKSVWAEGSTASAELDEIRSQLYHITAFGSDATTRPARRKAR
jgi:hypothetical protein